MQRRTVGVEEELLLVDPDDGTARAMCGAVLRDGQRDGQGGGQLEQELQREQVETGTRPTEDMPTLAAEIRRCRAAAARAASEVGAEVAALGTSPLPVAPSATPADRYQRMVARFGLTAEEQLSCGCHVHVAVSSDEEGVGVLDRIRVWLPALLALSANSPFWQGRDSGYASFRSQVWGRWPSAGPTERFGSAEEYHRTVDAMIGSDTLLDEGMIYFDARLSRHFPTVEVRVADVCLLAQDAVLLAALTRALVETSARAWQADEPPPVVRTELLRLATWRAARSGLGGTLLDPRSQAPAAAAEVLHGLVAHVAPALADFGDRGLVDDLLDEVVRRGGGDRLQREVHRRCRSLRAVVADAVRRTTAD